MRIEISSDVDTIVLQNGLNTGSDSHFYLNDDGLEGWFETPGLRESSSDNPNGDGSLPIPVKRQKERTVTIRGTVFPDSSVEQNEAVDRLNDLMCRDLVLTVFDTVGPRHVKAYIPDDNGMDFDAYGRELGFTIILCCPDPLKYGIPAVYTAKNNRFTVENRGMVASYPVVTVSNPNGVGFVSVTDDDGHEVAWEGDGSATEVVLDFRDLNPQVGSITVNEVFTVPHGSKTVYLTATSNSVATLMIEPAWR